MKTRLLTFVIAIIALVSCNKSTFNVNVELQNAEGKMVYLKKMLNKEFVLIDSAVMQDNKTNFIVESGNIADYYSVSLEGVKYPINFFSENKDMSIVGDVKDNKNITVTGSNATAGNITAGVVVDILELAVKPDHYFDTFGVYAGAGYGVYQHAWQLNNGNWVEYGPTAAKGISATAGVIGSVHGFTLKAGVNTIGFRYMEIEAGIGWMF